MESNNESKVLNVNLKTPDETEAEEIDTKAKIEQCFDDNKNVNAVEFIPGEKNGTEIILKKVEVQSEDKKDDSYSDFVDTAKMAKDPKRVAEESSEKGNKSMEVIVTLPTPTSTGVVINEQMMEKPQPEQFKKSGNVKENELVKSEITEGEEGVFIKVDDESIVAAAVDYKDTEAVVNEHTTLGSSAVQPKESQDQVNTEQLKQQEVRQAQKDDCGNNIRNSDIDSNIEQENIALLKRQQKELLEKQKDLTQKIHQQQLIAQHLAEENRIHQQKLQEQKQQQNLSESQTKLQQAARNNPSPFSYKQTLSPYQPQKKISQYLTVEETKDEYGYTQKTEAYESKVRYFCICAFYI
ncbi:DNA ligase 1 [Ceratitis capitata]|uniref:DNA ligase 1 n=1 Tax=Ceratitis capitata TaxID=7213 RepID=UPI000329C2FF|nr:DNA ligase 1 [Ceratitis capitata]XP_004523054.1 DNA ligase 1 [Ceratitis capitata]XP_004523055.1 DNA ligase 1 [Ceratitis capitata]XP_004523057.1 DNA ligase 1 [Ceratitis capitata]